MGSRKQNRLAELKELISARSSLHIKDAAEFLDVSEMTVRRDVSENSDQFDYLGGHIVIADSYARCTPYDLGMASDVHEIEKRQACQHCMPFVKDQEIIFVDCGTTLIHLIDLLPDSSEMTLVCYALNVAHRAIRRSNIKLVLVGGEYHAPTASFAGLGAETMYSNLGIGVGFFSAAGLDMNLGATCSSFDEAVQKRAAIVNSKQRILVVDSTKIGKVHPARYAEVGQFDAIVTENGHFEFSGHDAETTDTPQTFDRRTN